VTSTSEEETAACAAEFSRRLRPGDCVALYGELGAGKTRFVQGVCRGLGVREHVASPTFTIVNEYRTPELRIVHFDFYRVASPAELREIGFEEYLDSGGICLIEWAGKAEGFLPAERYEVRMAAGANERTRSIVIEHLAGGHR
jgi:tRNA threonylcarbamoyladenosine biosynthesis protein TsaE